MVAELTAQAVPCRLDTERSLLGLLVASPQHVAERVRGRLSPDMFYGAGNGALFAAALELASKPGGLDANGSVDMAQLLPALERQVADPFALVTAALEDPSKTLLSVGNYGSLIRETHERRELMGAGLRIAALAQDPDGKDTAEIFSAAEAALFEVTQAGGRQSQAVSVQRMLDYLDGYIVHGIGGQQFLPIGIGKLELAVGRLTAVAARPAMGKSSLMRQIAIVALRAGETVVLWSGEMSYQELSRLLISALSGVPAGVIKSRNWSPEQLGRLDEARQEFASWQDRLTIIDRGGMTAKQIVTEARRYRPTMLLADHLHCMAYPGKGRRDLEMGEATGVFRDYARNEDVTTVLASQCNRKIDEQPLWRRIPARQHIRECGALEQDAFGIWTMFRPHGCEDRPKHLVFPKGYRSEGLDVPEDWGVIRECKKRDGVTGTYEARFLGQLGIWADRPRHDWAH